MIPRYSRPEMSAIWTDQSKYQLWLDVEILVVEALAKQGKVVPQKAVDTIKAKAKFNPERILEIENEVKHDVIAFLTNVAENVGEDARFLHFGMTSSDLLDTVFAVQLCRATDLILKGVDGLMAAVKTRAFEHKLTVCVGRTHGIHAEPMTFGLKLASWYAELARGRERIVNAREGIAVGAISGPVGTYAYLDPSVEAYVCEKLGLKQDPVSTQVISRDRHAALFLSYAEFAATIERICLEVRHLQRTEVREAEENFTKGQKGSSAMPHKRNPILTENVTGLSRIVRSLAASSLENVALWHERDISHSSAERVIAPDITVGLDFMIGRVTGIVKNLQVYPENMQRNLDLTGGLVYSGTLLVELAARGIAREKAYSLVQKHGLATWDQLNSEGLANPPFPERIKSDPEITALIPREELERLFSLDHHLSQVDYIFKRVFG